MKNATFLHYTEESFTDWKEKAGADYGYIAVDPGNGTLVKSWGGDCMTPEQAEKELNGLGYTLGVGIDG